MSYFNLIDERWIPVIDLAGNREERSILDTLLNAENYSSIEDPSPLVTASLYRFLLAILYRAIEGPCSPIEAKELFKNGLPKEKILNYLNKWHDRFWLFDEKYPFGQIAEFTPKTWRAWTALTSEHNADNAKVLFDHVCINKAGQISLLQAVRWLLAKQTFALSAGNSELAHTGSSPSADALLAIVIGRNLLDTLHFNLVPENKDVLKNDLTIWERCPETINYLSTPNRSNIENEGNGHTVIRIANGIADMYTWRSRTITFKQEKEDLISEIGFASGVGYAPAQFDDPMVCFQMKEVKNKITGEKELKKLTIRFTDKGIWRDFDSLLPDGGNLSPKVIENSILLVRNEPTRYPSSILVLGQSNNKAKIEFWRMENFKLPKFIIENKFIRNDIKMFINEAEDVSSIIYKACESIAKMELSKGGRKVDTKDVISFVQQMPLLSQYWSEMEKSFHSILTLTADERKDIDEIHNHWLISIKDSLLSSWDLYEHSLNGTDPWALRAFVKANGIIASKSKELQEMIEKLKPTETPTHQEVV